MDKAKWGIIAGGIISVLFFVGSETQYYKSAKAKVEETAKSAIASVSGESNDGVEFKEEKGKGLTKSQVDSLGHGAGSSLFPLWGPDDFREAKRELKEITQQHPYSFYCGCDINFSGQYKEKLSFDFERCGFKPRKSEWRANRAEAEHIVPISWYGHNLQCWQNGGRENCQRVSEKFRRAEGDLVNLQYTVGEVNGDRRHYRYSVWQGGEGQYGACPAKVDFGNNRFQPREEIRGWISRVHYYMYSKYGVQLSDSQQKLMAAWFKIPPTPWECRYNEILKERFGSKAGNPYTERACAPLH